MKQKQCSNTFNKDFKNGPHHAPWVYYTKWSKSERENQLSYINTYIWNLDCWQSRGQQEDQTSQFLGKSVLNTHWKDWCWSWSSNTLAPWCKEPNHWKRPWCWERLRAGGGGDDRGWDGWMASPTQRTWVWVNSRGWWWTGKPGVLQSMGSQRVGHDWRTELTDMPSNKKLIKTFCTLMQWNMILGPY